MQGALSSSHEPLLVAILGPTGSGKSQLAIAIAQRFPTEIVSCDSVAIYRHFEIGTAKPSAAEQRIVPHHLIDVAEPDQPFTAGEYARRARAAVRDIVARGKLPVVVGGTGLYLRAFLEGLFPGPQRCEELRDRLRGRARQRGSPYIHRILSRIDRVAAAQIHPNDEPKLIRAIEVCLATRQSMSHLLRERPRDPLPDFRVLRIGLNPQRELLYERINHRAAQMFDAGLVEETRQLLERYGSSPNAMALQSLGYKQAAQFLRGELTRDQAVAATQQGHRNYAKRQITWFRREPEVHWLPGFGDDAAVVERAVELVTMARGERSHCE
jgi:tRNA dimethylallyltransferase